MLNLLSVSALIGRFQGTADSQMTYGKVCMHQEYMSVCRFSTAIKCLRPMLVSLRIVHRMS